MTTQLLLTPVATKTGFTLNPFRWSQRTGALVSGWALALMAVAAVFGYFIAIKGLWVAGDATATVNAIAHSPALWIAGVATMFLVAILDVIAAAGTFALFKPVNRTLSTIAGVTRTLFAVSFMVAIGQLVVAFTQLAEPAKALASIETFSTIWQTGLGVFGIYLLMVAYLTWRSGFIPKLFAILIGIAGIGYMADLAGLTFVAGFAPTFGSFGFIGETAMIFWLLIKGRHLPRS